MKRRFSKTGTGPKIAQRSTYRPPFAFLLSIPAGVCKRAVDIAIAIDASGSVGRWGYREEQTFIRKMVQSYGISQSGTHVAIIQYSSKATVEIPLTRYYTYSRFVNALGRLPYTGGMTRIDLALKLAAEKVFVPSGGSRSNVPKIMILMTDGHQTEIPNESIPLDKAVLALRRKDVQVYALAIGPHTKEEELRLIVKKKDSIFKSSTFSGLLNVVNDVVRKSCTEGEY